MTDKLTLNLTATFDNDPNTTIRVYQDRKKKHLKGTNFAFIFLNMFEELASDKELNLTDIRVLCGLLANLDFGNQINIPQSKLAKDIGIAQQNISTSVNKLIEKEYLIILTKKGKQNVYQLNLECGLKGSPEDLQSLKSFWNARKKASNKVS